MLAAKRQGGKNDNNECICKGKHSTGDRGGRSGCGIAKLARIFCGDIEKVTGHQPECVEGWQENASDHILVATCGSSKILAELEAQKKVDLSQIRGKKEVYGIFCLENVPEQGKNVLVIAGSDKRGAAYGMFYISQKIGVSPWVFWADAVPKKRKKKLYLIKR